MEWTDFLWKMLENILVAVLPVLVTALTAWLIQQIRNLGGKIDARTMAQITWAVDVAVKAAEQAGAAGLIEEKKAYALSIAYEWLKKNRIKIDPYLIEGLVEAAVFEAFNSSEEPAE